MLLDGSRTFPRLFPPDLIAAARTAVEELCHTLHPGDPRWPAHVCPLSVLKEHRNPGIAPERLADIPFLLSGLPVLSEALAALILHPPLWQAAAEILESDAVIYHFSNVTRKPPHIGPNIAWHRDYPNEFICPRRSDHFFRILIPLEPMDESNGCTLVLPGTHHLTDEAALTQPKEADYSQAAPLILQPGDAAAIHPKLLHGGRENRSERERNLIVLQFGHPTDDYLHTWPDEPLSGLRFDEISTTLST